MNPWDTLQNARQVEDWEAEAEWITEARGEGYTWKQLSIIYGMSIRALKEKSGVKK